MKILSWNVNSVRIRLTQLLELILSESPDVICLQETKVENQSFPLKEIHKAQKVFMEKKFIGKLVLIP